MMVGGLLLLLVTTSLHVSVVFSLVFLLGNMGALGGPCKTLSEGRLKLLRAAQRGLECVETGSAGPCPEQDPSFVQGPPRKVRKDEQLNRKRRGAPEREQREGDNN